MFKNTPENIDQALDWYFQLKREHPSLFVQRALRRLVLDQKELRAFAVENGTALGVTFSNPYVIVVVDLVESRTVDGRTIRYPYFRTIARKQLDGGFNVVIIATIADAALGRPGDIVLVEQERHATGRTELELPRGFAEAGLNAAENACKELTEETGFVGLEVTLLGKTLVDSGQTDNMVHFLHIPVIAKNAAAPEAHEAISGIRLMSRAELWSAFGSGLIRDGFTLQAIGLLDKLNRP
jgi:ADP-ribose pyrophosphatase